MPKDERLYARFDIGMDEHPKVMLLSDAGFRCLFEATFYSRRQMTDGFLDRRVALKKWGAEVIAELESNHPERPSLMATEDGWQIRDYAEHQTTRADIEAKREAGRKGGLARAKQAASTPKAGASNVPKQNGSDSQAKTETETETSTSNEVEKRTAKRGTRLSPEWMPSAESVAKARADAPNVDHRSEHTTFVDYWIAQPGQRGVKLDWDATWRNWMRRKQSDLAPRPGKPSKADQVADVLDMGRRLQAAEEQQGAIGA